MNKGKARRYTQGRFPPGRAMLKITVNSMMEGVEKADIKIGKDATVKDLKIACGRMVNLKSDRQSLMYDGKELRDEDSPLRQYGITSDCTVSLHPRMLSGTRERNPSSNIILVMPSLFIDPGTLASLTAHVPSTFGPVIDKLPQGMAEKQTNVSTDTEVEHWRIRERMRSLMSRRKSAKGVRSSPSVTKSETASIIGSVCSSVSRTSSKSGTNTSPRSVLRTKSASSLISNFERKNELDGTVTEKELKGFFDPPETVQEMEFMRKDMYDPPENMEQLEKMREQVQHIVSSRCRMCRKRLRLAQRSMMCACDGAFCSEHRNPELHQCSVDYKQEGRIKLSKENPKLDDGCAHNKGNQDMN